MGEQFNPLRDAANVLADEVRTLRERLHAAEAQADALARAAAVVFHWFDAAYGEPYDREFFDAMGDLRQALASYYGRQMPGEGR